MLIKAKEAKKERTIVRSDNFAAKFEFVIIAFAHALLFTEQSWILEWIQTSVAAQIRFEYATCERKKYSNSQYSDS